MEKKREIGNEEDDVELLLNKLSLLFLVDGLLSNIKTFLQFSLLEACLWHILRLILLQK